MTQNEMVLRHIEEHGYLTTRDALLDMGIQKVAAVIKALKKLGVPIVATVEGGQTTYRMGGTDEGR